ncbi:DUF4127 family protein [Occultella glacieicola]|uniref:DUF4127 family protein n=1 Tax=Occultella glacieicola TaxID=2518684 RepID=A0ABY2E208_9MICO|nr:Ig domain-containing protein [Occultella glacieicola]TDE92616.1 DUF4127 family protein [Occultella glacieicola]
MSPRPSLIRSAAAPLAAALVLGLSASAADAAGPAPAASPPPADSRTVWEGEGLPPGRDSLGDVALLPLDDRPYTWYEPLELGAAAGYEVVTPTQEILGRHFTPGDGGATMSLWNMIAASFLLDLETTVGTHDGRYGDSAARARAFLAEGLEANTDWYTVRFSSTQPARDRIVAMRASRADCQDNRWHRKSSCDYVDGGPSGGNLGTDMIEYGLAGLYRYEHALSGAEAAHAAVADTYRRYTALPAIHTASSTDPLDCVDDTRSGPVDPYYPPDNQGTDPTGDPWDFDPHLSFGGYIRSSGTILTLEAKYYDIVGFGILAEVRHAVVPDRYDLAWSRVAASGDDALVAIQYRDLSPMALPTRDIDDTDGDGDLTEPVCIVTLGTLPIAHNGIGLLATYGYVQPLEVGAATMPDGVLSSGYDGHLVATGGRVPLAWSVLEGHLPAGLALSPGGDLTGVPALPGTTSFTAQVADADGRTATTEVAVTVGGCDRSLTGPQTGALIVATGVVCLDGATQAGRVTVSGDVVMVVVSSTVRGGISATDAAAVAICGSTVTGRVHTETTTGRVLVDPAGCAGSDINGR